MKKALGIFAAVMVMSAFTVTVSATDYPEPPRYIIEVTDTVQPSDIKDALKTSNPTIYISDGNVVISKSALREIAKGGKKIKFTADGYTITINPNDITDDARSINLKMTVKNAKKIEGVSAAAVIIQPAASGDFGFSLTVSVPTSVFKSAGIKTSGAKAYYIGDNGSIKEKSFSVNSDGSVSVKFNHASYYAITEKSLTSKSGTDNGKTGKTGKTGNGGNDSNPTTGITIALTGLAAAGITAVSAKKKKK